MSRCWRNVIGHTLATAIEFNPTWDEAIWQTAEPGILVNTKPHKGKQIPVGASKMGGLPDLHPDTEWPEGESGPAAFVLVVALSILVVLSAMHASRTRPNAVQGTQ